MRIIADARLSTGEVGQTLPLGWDEFEVLRVVEGLQFVVGKWSRRQAVNFGSAGHFGGDNMEVKAVVVAATEVGEKYMDQQVSKALRSADYHSILAKIAKVGPDAMAFTKAQVESGLNDSEKRKFNNFLRKMKRLNVIVPAMSEASMFLTHAWPVCTFGSKVQEPLGSM